MHVVIFAGGTIQPGRAVQAAIASADLIIAADSGAATALHYGRVPAIIVGDFDSLEELALQKLQEHGSRLICVAAEKNGIWMVTGTERGAGLIKYDAATGRTLEIAEFAESDCDPHGLAWHNGVLYSCDAGIHPGWPENKSATHGYIFRIDLL